ncbi:MAG TPA: sugar kinase [Chloroflexota bacterium]|nr:sugar kinase [Chloroflexota bacterium]
MTACPEIISVGTMLVEVMRIELDEPLGLPGTFVGPFPSGDTPIYADTVARLGRSVGFIGAVGQDDFGRCLLDRFARDGVDFSCGKVLAEYTTGVAFVAYFRGGSRKFLFHWRHAAAGQLGTEYVQPDYFQAARWLHLTGCTMTANESSCLACLRALDVLPDGARVSFDPNVRPELLSAEQIRQIVRPVLDRADVVIPSLGEAMMLTGAATDEEGCRVLAAKGKLVVLKLGERGCRIFHGAEDFSVPSFPTQEVDPTGAGDSFCAGFTVALLEGMDLWDAARFANAAGAMAVTKKGPMEGAPTRQEVLRLIEAGRGPFTE